MRILFICSAKVWGGNEKWVANTMEGLQNRHDVFFLGRAPHLQEQFGSNIPSFWAPFRSVFDWETRKIIQDIVQENEIDVIVSTKKKEYFLAGLVARGMRIRHVLRLGIVRKMRIPFWSRLVYQRLNDGIIVNAGKIKNQLHKYRWMKNHPVKVIYNGLDERCRKDKATNEEAGGFLIVSTGMLTRRKGFNVLIDAIAGLPEQYQRKLQLHILGEGREKENLKKQIQFNRLQDVVCLEGFNDPFPWLKRAGLFCLLSRNEGVSNALLEAMSCGVPVLTTDAGGSGEFINHGENGFLTPGKPHLVAGQLKQILDMPSAKLLKIGNNGEQTVKALFNHKRMVEEVESFLHNFA
ncbi:glycosyltransferase [Marinilabilia rubra]|uniref:Glycosyltransferase n=1 Tax=Marinilabilia rubra TaxID=2162893 RepID=A0A2U2BBT2_9BACT|nr:glycosyltransferase [Marinilabilia rubra]PWE00526.1 glycosyltransferase [Marinilabilia rubra]